MKRSYRSLLTLIACFNLASCAGPGLEGTAERGRESAPADARYDGEVRTLALDENVLYVGGGFSRAGGKPGGRIAKLTLKGEPLPFFGSTTASVPEPLTGEEVPFGFDGNVNVLAIAADGSRDLFVGGDFNYFVSEGTVTTHAFFTRLTASGRVASTFRPGLGPNAPVTVMTPVGDGSGDIFLGGSFTQYNGAVAGGLARVSAEGELVGAFDTGSGFNGAVNALLLAKDGSNDLIVGGDFTAFKGTAVGHLARLTTLGELVSTFVAGAGLDKPVRCLAAFADSGGVFYVGGAFTKYKEAAAAKLVALKPDGSMDSTFSIGRGFDADVRGVNATPDGALWVWGDFSKLSHYPSPKLVRLFPNGTMDRSIKTGRSLDGNILTLLSSAAFDGFLLGGDFKTSGAAPVTSFGHFDRTGNLVDGF